MASAPGNLRRLAPLLVLLGSGLMNASVHHPPHRLAVEQIQELEGSWRAAQLTADVPAMDRLLSEDFLGITAAGSVVTKAQQLERMRTRRFVIRQLDMEDVKIKLVGTMAIVTSLATVDGETSGKPMHGSFRYTRVYKRLAGGMWKIMSFEATRLTPAATFSAARGHPSVSQRP